MAKIEPLTALPPGTRLLLGGDRWIEVSANIAHAFRPGDALIVVEEAEQVLLVPAAERRIAHDAVSRAHVAFAAMRAADDDAITRFYEGFAQRLGDDDVWSAIAAANADDVAAAERRGRSTTRLAVHDRMRAEMIAGLHGWITTGSRRGHVMESLARNGFDIELVGAPLGVVAFVFEGRPNVLADATGVLRGGNSVVFRIGSDALHTAQTIMQTALTPALVAAGLPEGAVSLVQSAEHAAGWALFGDARLSLAVARGSGPSVALLGALARKAGVPVSLHGTGGAWIVMAAGGDPANGARLEAVIFDSLDRKVCNSLNTLCIPRSRAAELMPFVLRGLTRAGERLETTFKLHVVQGDEAAVPSELFSRDIAVHRAHGVVTEKQAESIAESELGREWEWERTPEVTLKLIDSTQHAVELFNRYSPQFVASLIGGSDAEMAQFYEQVNAPFVCDGHTRWVDGQKALDKPELGLSNWQWGRLFARGGVLSGDGVYTVRTRARFRRG
jgi:glutamate-5-semialdehyde dehydrogenase